LFQLKSIGAARANTKSIRGANFVILSLKVVLDSFFPDKRCYQGQGSLAVTGGRLLILNLSIILKGNN
jgi:hypothetical protein